MLCRDVYADRKGVIYSIYAYLVNFLSLRRAQISVVLVKLNRLMSVPRLIKGYNLRIFLLPAPATARRTKAAIS